jgi:hypothetical protein
MFESDFTAKPIFKLNYGDAMQWLEADLWRR